MSSVIALNQIDGSELWKKVGFKHSEKVLVALRGVYNLPFNLDDPVYLWYKCLLENDDIIMLKGSRSMQLDSVAEDIKNHVKWTIKFVKKLTWIYHI